MSGGRPFKLACFIPRDEKYFQKVDKLQRDVVLHTNEPEIQLQPDQVVQYAARTKLVRDDEISVGILTRGRYLIFLPVGLAPKTFIQSTPTDLWDFGYSFQPWLPLEDAAIVIPSYRIVVELVGVPIHLWREEEAMRAVSYFGTYLGTVVQQDPANFNQWTVVVTTDYLERVLENVALMVGGLEFLVEIRVITWSYCPIYTPADLPQPLERFTRPIASSSSDNTTEEGSVGYDEELVPMSKKVIREICRGRDLNSLPSEFREIVLSGEDRGVAVDKQLSTQKHDEIVTTNPRTSTMQQERPQQTQVTVNPKEGQALTQLKGKWLVI